MQIHIHTTKSDGSYEPEKIIDILKEDGKINVISIADHNEIRSSLKHIRTQKI